MSSESTHDSTIGTILPFDFVICGGAGDLSLRKLMPALYYRECSGRLPDDAALLGLGRAPMTREQYVTKIEAALRKYVGANFKSEVWEKFRLRLDYLSVDADVPSTFEDLKKWLAGREDRVRVFYLAVAPSLYGNICRDLQQHKLVTDKSRVVLEKPIGHDLDSSRQINDVVGSAFREGQIFRIDHYLGKETVQNLMVLRFANSLFEPLWNLKYIDHVQITATESIGVEGRSAYYEQAGALRDMVQNHLLQLLCLVAMEPPTRLERDGVRDEKLKVLRALRPISGDQVAANIVRGQYRKGAIDGGPVPGYVEEIGHPSKTETFVAIKASIDNWRWAGVPFYLRTGKRLAARFSEIVIQFKPVPHRMFPGDIGEFVPNRLVIRLQPNEGVRLHMMNKVPGAMRIRSVPLDVSFEEAFHTRTPDAYERLLMDVVRGDSTLFMRRDEVDAAWMWIEQIRRGWSESDSGPHLYSSGSWGPTAAIALIERDGRTWQEDVS